MKLLLTLVVVVTSLGVLQSAEENEPKGIPEEILKQLSMDGEKLVDEEVRRALYGVKQMKEVMWRNEQKHEHLMKSLQHSSDKKKSAAQLAKEVTDKLQEAEEQCRDSLQDEWEQCRPCLEDTCKDFYTSTCRRGFSSFHSKVENFFRRVSRRFGSREPRVDSGDILVNQADAADTQVARIEDSFKRLMSTVGSMVNRSVTLVSRMRDRVDRVLQNAFLDNTDTLRETEATPDPYDPSHDSAFLQGVGLEEVLESFFDFGRSVVEEFGAVVTQVFDDVDVAVEEEKKKRERMSFPRFLQNRKLCRDLRKQTSECWQLHTQCEVCQGALLTECPSVRELHVELDEVSQLLDVSKEQYDEILSIVQRHTDETVNWLSNMAAEFSWVAQTVNNSSTPENIFRISMVAPKSHDENMAVTDTKVEVNILNSPSLILSVPGDLDLQDPAFIQYLTQEALDKYKQMVRFDE